MFFKYVTKCSIVVVYQLCFVTYRGINLSVDLQRHSCDLNYVVIIGIRAMKFILSQLFADSFRILPYFLSKTWYIFVISVFTEIIYFSLISLLKFLNFVNSYYFWLFILQTIYSKLWFFAIIFQVNLLMLFFFIFKVIIVLIINIKQYCIDTFVYKLKNKIIKIKPESVFKNILRVSCSKSLN